MQLMPNTLGLT